MTAAGFGDATARYASSVDWYINHALFAEEYDERLIALVAGVEPLCLEHPERVRDRVPEAMKGLFDALLLSGIAMTIAGTSSPASGAEHLVSHALDMMSTLDGVEHDLHGRQVGVGSVLAAEICRRLLELPSPRFDAEAAVATDFSAWGAMREHVTGAYAPKVAKIRSAARALSRPGAWDALRKKIVPMARSPELIRERLATVGGAVRAADIGCSKARLVDALLRCHQMRARFTVLDLAWMTGVMPAAAAEVVERFA